jgi:hypothetical protein
MMGQSEKLNSSQIIFITICLQVHNVATRFTSPSNSLQWCWAITIFLSQIGKCWLFFLCFYCAGWCTEWARLEMLLLVRWGQGGRTATLNRHITIHPSCCTGGCWFIVARVNQHRPVHQRGWMVHW